MEAKRGTSSMNRTLLEITADLDALDALLNEVGGDVSDPKVEEAVAGWFAELDQDFRGKVDNYLALIVSMEARAKGRAEQAERLKKRAKSDESAASFLRARLKFVLEQRGVSKLDTDRFRVSVARNGGMLPLEVFEEKVVPEHYYRVIPEQRVLDGAAIRAALESGQEVPGAKLGERTTRLSIR